MTSVTGDQCASPRTCNPTLCVGIPEQLCKPDMLQLNCNLHVMLWLPVLECAPGCVTPRNPLLGSQLVRKSLELTLQVLCGRSKQEVTCSDAGFPGSRRHSNVRSGPVSEVPNRARTAAGSRSLGPHWPHVQV